jgi:ornithine carbamoyltransferase
MASLDVALAGLAGGDFLSSGDLERAEAEALLALAAQLKAGSQRFDLTGRVLRKGLELLGIGTVRKM